jgi:rhodanese-related sulfurtransferase
MADVIGPLKILAPALRRPRSCTTIKNLLPYAEKHMTHQHPNWPIKSSPSGIGRPSNTSPYRPCLANTKRFSKGSFLTTAFVVSQDQRPIIIDVREPAEYRDLHLYGSINIPSTGFEAADYAIYEDRDIYLVCHTGRRSKGVREKLEAAGFTNVHLSEIQMQFYAEQHQVNPGIEGSWTVDRQFRLFLGAMLLLSLIGLAIGSHAFLTVPLIIALGLTITAVIDRCYLKMLIARAPWNR